jgi:hypothetical protein
MANETVREFLDRRERELTHQLAAARGHVTTIEAEIQEVQRAKEALGPHQMALEARLEARSLMTGTAEIGKPELKGNEPQFTTDAMPKAIQRFAEMTIKELVILALLDHFPQGGTATAIRDFIRDAYGRIIEPSSLRPQLKRMKEEGSIQQDPATDAWRLTLPLGRAEANGWYANKWKQD